MTRIRHDFNTSCGIFITLVFVSRALAFTPSASYTNRAFVSKCVVKSSCLRRYASSSTGINAANLQSSSDKQHSQGQSQRQSGLSQWNETHILDSFDQQWHDLQKLNNADDEDINMTNIHLMHQQTQLSQQLERKANSSNDSGPMESEGLSDVWKARLLLVGAAALYGTNFSLVKLLGDVMPVGVSTTLRFGAAALVTAPWLLKSDHDNNDSQALTSAWLGFEVGLWNSIGYVSQAVGLDTVPAAQSAFICSLAVVTVPILDFLAGKKLLPKQWVGAVLAVVGVAFLELLGNDTGSTSNMITSGDLLTLVQPLAFGVGFWRMERAMHRFPNEASRMTASQLLAVFMASLVYGLWAIDLPTLQSYPWADWLTSPQLLFSLFWTGVVTTAMTIYMENKAMETLSAAETTLIFSTEPLWGTAFAAVVMGEQLGPNVGLGAFFILSACLYSNLGMAGIQNLIGQNSASMENLTTSERDDVVFGSRNSHVAHDHTHKPFSLTRQFAWFSSSAATSWAWWKVAVSNIPSLDEATDVFEEIFRHFQ